VSEILQVDPRKLHLPPSRRDGADPVKLQRQIAKHGKQTDGMPPLIVHRGKDGEMMIYDGVTRATRVAKLLPGQTGDGVNSGRASQSGFHEVPDSRGEIAMKTTRDELFDALTELSVLFPSMRFGQLLEMVATAAGAESVADMERTTDAQISQEAIEMASHRVKQLELGPICKESLTFERRDLIETLRQRSQFGPGSLMAVLVQIARETNTTSYDIEDGVLLRRLNPQDAVA
jgi:hypothetical protein